MSERQPSRAEMLEAMDRAERLIREIATTWPTEISGFSRWVLLRAANVLERILLRAGRR